MKRYEKNETDRNETKSRNNKSALRPINTYIAETRSETSKPKRILETGKMKVQRTITGKALMNRERWMNEE